MSLKFLYVPDMDKFFNLVDSSHGDIYLNLIDGSVCSLKNTPFVKQLLKSITSNDELIITFSDQKDQYPFIRYMIDARVKN